jgi:hypothetical protein
MKRKILTFTLIILLAACGQSGQRQSTVTPTNNADTLIIAEPPMNNDENLAVQEKTSAMNKPDVYVVGLEIDKHLKYVKLWKNGVPQPLSEGIDGYPSAFSVFVSDGDVYATGIVDGDSATIWKNGVRHNLEDDASPYSVFVVDGDVYVAGCIRNEQRKNVATVWKNGVAQTLTDGTTSAAVHSIFVTGGDIYAAGYEMNETRNRFVALWKNGEKQYFHDIIQDSEAHSIFVHGEDIYIAGEEGRKATLWINGKSHHLSDQWSEANSVYVYGGNVYVAGTDGGGAKLWNWSKGIAYNLSDGTESSEANSVFVHNRNVYVVGREDAGEVWDIPKLWINGVAQKFFPDEVKRVFPSAVFVTGDSVFDAKDEGDIEFDVEFELI